MIFQYASIKSIRDYGITSAQFSDAATLQLIIKYSTLINKWTEQIFIPMQFTERLDGGKNLYMIRNKKIIKLNSINLVNSDLSRTPIEASYYEVIGNLIKLNILTPDSPKILEINGMYGNLDNAKDVSITLTSSIVKDSTSFTVTDASVLEERDILLHGNYSIIVNSINYSTNTISIDKFAYNATISSGTVLNCYGAIPSLVEQAIQLLIKNNKTLERQLGGRIKSETTDDYSYEVFENKGNSSGINEVDKILNSLIEGNFDVMYL